MSERMTMTRRALMNTAAAAGAAGMLDGIAQAQAPTTNLPAANEVLIRDAFVISMNPAIGDLPHGDIHVRDGSIVSRKFVETYVDEDELQRAESGVV
jgi:5-methylthioadenosine/S-adenosylhomocysteine deaminase